MAFSFGKASTNYARGGQTYLHKLRMIWQVFRYSFIGMFLLFSLTFTYFMSQKNTLHDLYLWGKFHITKHLFLHIYDRSADEMTSFYYEDFSVGTTRMITFLNNPKVQNIANRVESNAKVYALYSLFIFLIFGLLIILFFTYKGKSIRKDRDIRGSTLVNKRQLIKAIRIYNLKKLDFSLPFTLAGVPYPSRAETQGTLISGAPGTGKTVALSDLIQQIRDRGDKAIIYDKMGSFIPYFYDDKQDTIINPIDERSPAWTPFLEVDKASDFETMAAASIVLPPNVKDPFFVQAARIVFSEVCLKLYRQGRTTNKAIIDTITRLEFSEVIEFLEGTPAQILANKDGPRVFQSIMSVLLTNIKSMTYLRDDSQDFSIKEWIWNEKEQGTLWVSSRADMHETLKPLISMWMDIAVNSVLSMDGSRSRRIWFIFDELPSLNRLPSLESGMAETRQFGGCFVIGFQLYSQLQETYGDKSALTISGLCKRRLILAAHDEKNAEFGSFSLGKKEVEESLESVSYGANTMRDGANVSKRNQMKQLVIPSEIMNLPDLKGYLRTGGKFPVCEVKLAYKKRKVQHERLKLRSLTIEPIKIVEIEDKPTPGVSDIPDEPIAQNDNSALMEYQSLTPDSTSSDDFLANNRATIKPKNRLKRSVRKTQQPSQQLDFDLPSSS